MKKTINSVIHLSLILSLAAILPGFAVAQDCINISPEFGFQGDNGTVVQINAAGTHFLQGDTEVDFENVAITVTDIDIIDNDTLNVTIDVAVNAPVGRGDITVTTGSEQITCEDAFEIRQWVTLVIDDAAGFQGEQDVPVSVSLENHYGAVMAVQVDVCDEENYITLSGSESCLTTGRTTGFLCSTNELTSGPTIGCVRVLLLSFSGALIEPGEGPIFILNHDVSNGAPLGECRDLDSESIKISNSSSNNLKVTPVSGEFCFLSDLDSDGDGVPDYLDNCPFDNNTSQTDTDNDTVGDICDGCPADPEKIEPGFCGCGTSDVDSDSDTIPDCNDICPYDSDNDIDNDTICGDVDVCPYDPENDSDNDTICGDVDNCPLNSNSTELGMCVKHLSGLFIGMGTSCTGYQDCKEDEFCQLGQEDHNTNGIGDACECYADCDNDTTVGLFDLAIMKTDFGFACPPCDADLNDDNGVGLFDLAIMKVQFGRSGCPVVL